MENGNILHRTQGRGSQGGGEGVYRPEGHFGGPAREAWQGKSRLPRILIVSIIEGRPEQGSTTKHSDSPITDREFQMADLTRPSPIKERVEIRKMQNVYFQNLLE